MRFRFNSVVAAVLASILIAGVCDSAFGQASGRITGTVVDPSGDVIVGADVTLLSETTGEVTTVQTNRTGTFSFPNMPPTTYTIRVTFEGFATHEETGIPLTVGQTLSLGNITLSLGSVTETITVKASGAALETQTTGVTSMLTDGQLEGLMQRGRDIVALMTVLPGVSQTANSSALGGNWGTDTPNFNGARAGFNNFQLDGSTGNDVDAQQTFQLSVSMDAIQEVSVQSNAYQAEYGRVPGAQVNIVSKSGTREFHGSGYWFKRHEMFNANNFFNNRLGLEKPRNRFLTLGGTIGGPIYIPGKFNKDKNKLFFFVSREDWRIKSGPPIFQATVPTALERAGDFSQSFEQDGSPIPVFDPLTRDPVTGEKQMFANNVIPASRINPLGQAMLRFLPEPNQLDVGVTRGAFNNQFQETSEQPKGQIQTKIDWVPTSNDRIFFRPRFWEADLQAQFSTVAFNPFNTSIFKQRHHYNFLNRNYGVGYTKTVSPTVVNEFNFSWFQSREKGDLTDEFDLANVRKANVGLEDLGQFFPEGNPLGLVPKMTFNGVPQAPSIDFDPRTPIDAGDDRWQIRDNVSWIKGSHTFKFGGFWELAHASEGPRSAQPGQHMGFFDFSRNTNNPFDSNNPFSNAILGNFFQYSESTGQSNGRTSKYILEFFAQDSWKATRNLTLEYGVRVSHFTPWRLREGEGSALVPANFSSDTAPALFHPGFDSTGARAAIDPTTGEVFPAPAIGGFVEGTGDRLNGVVVGGDPRFGDGFREDAFALGPRFGFAYDLGGKGKTAIRGSFAVVTQTAFNSQGEAWTVTTSPPILENPNVFFGNIDTFLSGDQVLFPSTVAAFDTDQDAPQVMQWMFGIQQDLGFDTVLDVSYVGNTSRHLFVRRDLNRLPPGTRFLDSSQDPTTGGPLQDTLLRPFQGFETIDFLENTATANYNALQVSVNRRYAAGLQFGVAYTWSKTLGIADGDDFVPTFLDIRGRSYGKLGFDQTHVLVLNYLWDLPNARKFQGNALLKGIFHNWQVSGITTFASGFPQGINFSFTDGVDRLGGGDPGRVNISEDPTLDKDERTFNRFFDTAAIGAPVERGDFGNAPKDVFRGPGINNFDFTVMKNFPFGEGNRFQFRWEFFNLFNHTQFDGVDNNARFNSAGEQVNGQFGQIISARDARRMQVSLRVEF